MAPRSRTPWCLRPWSSATAPSAAIAPRSSSRPIDRPSCSAAAALARVGELNARRWASLPSGLGNAGSIFKNPPGEFAGRLIEACGLKGAREGQAEISPKHANVIVNLGGARATDVLALMQRARAAVRERFGVELEREIVLAGSLAADWPQD